MLNGARDATKTKKLYRSVGLKNYNKIKYLFAEEVSFATGLIVLSCELLVLMPNN
jgi:hypothetical protein